MVIDLTGRKALVTGASRGIGRAVALGLAAAGADVCVNYHQQAPAAEAVAAEIEKLGRRAIAVQADVAQEEPVKQLVAQTVAELGGLDILVNNAGVVADQYLAFMSDAQFDTVVDTCLKGAFHCCRAAVKPMIKGRWGRVVNISSVAAMMGDVRRANYAAAKAGLLGLTAALSRELAAQNVLVNAVAPGLVETDLTADMPEPRVEALLQMIPLGRFGTPEEVAGLVVFLASEQAAYITGQVFCIDGGLRTM